MPRPRILVAVSATAFAFSGGALAADPAALLPAGWSHAQINVTGPDGRPHTLIYDRGRVQSVTPSSITLKERDGSIVTIQVAPNAVVRVNGQRGSLSQILPGYRATTRGVDGRPAKLVRATAPPRLLRKTGSSTISP